MVREASKCQPADQEDYGRASFVEALVSGNLPQICCSARQLLTTTPASIRTARFIRSQTEARPPTSLQPLRIALLSSFSLELIEDSLWAHGLLEGLDLQIHWTGFDLYQQQILDPGSALYRKAPDVVVLAVEGQRWAPGLYDDFLREGWRNGDATVQAALDEVAALLREFRERSTAPVLFHALVPPRFPQFGVLDTLDTQGQTRLIARVNQGLAELAREIQGFYPIDLETIIRDTGYQKWYDPRLAFIARSPIARSAMDDLARLYMRYLRALTGRSRKCLVLDLDNTLWGGILGDEGPLGVELGSEYPGSAYVAFQHALLGLHQRGVLLAIASKNNAGDVDEIFQRNAAMVLKPEHFSSMQIHWEPKSLSLERLARTLDLGLEHMVLVDDDPAECAQVAAALPQVTTITLPKQPERYVEALMRDGWFDSLSLSAEDLRRSNLYRQLAAGERLRQTTGSLEDYYRRLQMTVYLAPVNDASLARAAQLSQKTNQFNTTTRRYTEADIAQRLTSTEWRTVTGRVTDRFGDNGIVCLAMARIRGTVLEIDTFLLSCRVIGRSVETAILHHLATLARAASARTIEGEIIATKRNGPVRDLYQRHGFSAIDSGQGDSIRWLLALAGKTIPVPAWLQIVEESDRETEWKNASSP